MKTKFYLCKHCGNVVMKLVDSGVTPVCCGEEMIELTPGTSDGAVEKHLPAVLSNSCSSKRCKDDDCTLKVQVGSVPHPMLDAHHIQFIYVETENGGQLRYLNPGEEPEAEFCTCHDKPVAVFEMCNIHGLWLTDLS